MVKPHSRGHSGRRNKGPVEGWMPFRKVFDVVASGRRHVVMGANQLDRHGNQNLSAFGPLQQPTRQMFGVRGAPGNTINHATSYFVPKHSKRVFVDKVEWCAVSATTRSIPRIRLTST